MPPKENKPVRLGSLRDYLHYLVSSLMLMSVSAVTILLGVVCAAAALFCLAQMFFSSGAMFDILSFLVIALFIGTISMTLLLVSMTLLLVGWSAAIKFKEVEPVEPLTPAKADLLPASETLVRASEEPTEGQEKILLRAAQPTEAGKPEELLRPTG